MSAVEPISRSPELARLLAANHASFLGFVEDLDERSPKDYAGQASITTITGSVRPHRARGASRGCERHLPHCADHARYDCQCQR